MPTAIVRVKTAEGFVIASDGLRLALDYQQISDCQQKITYIAAKRESVAIGVCGYGGSEVDPMAIMRRALGSMDNRKSHWSLAKYSEHLKSYLLKEFRPFEGHEAFNQIPIKNGRRKLCSMLLAGYIQSVWHVNCKDTFLGPLT